MPPLLTGIGLGFAAGISPGPLLTLVLTTALQRGFRAGLAVALAPLLTDLPIILLSLWILDRLPAGFLQALGLLGGLFVIYLGVETWRELPKARLAAASAAPVRQDLGRGVLVNLFSPHPWLFWLSVGGPLVFRYANQGLAAAGAFLLGFYTLLVGSKILLAAGVAGARHWLDDRLYRGLLWVGGAMLVGLGLLLVWESLPR